MSAMLSGLIGALVAFALVTIAERKRMSATVSEDGWKALRPGWLTIGTVVACTAFAALTSYFLSSGGSTRSDAATQNGFAVLLLAASAAAAVYIFWTTYGRTVMWKGDELRVRTLFGKETVQRISDVATFNKSETRGEYRLTFRDGSRLRFSALLHGARELIATLPRRALRD